VFCHASAVKLEVPVFTVSVSVIGEREQFMIGGREGNLRIRLYVHATHINVTVSRYGEVTAQAHKATDSLEHPAAAREEREREKNAAPKYLIGSELCGTVEGYLESARLPQ